MKRLKQLYVELFSDEMPTHICEETGEHWIASKYFCATHSHGYQRLTKNRMGLWKLETYWRGSPEPLTSIEDAR